ncbi:MAG: 50S ribosomal protein L6, partial [Methylococcus sp.]
RIAKIPIPIPSGVNVSLDGETIRVKGGKGELTMTLHSEIALQIDNSEIRVSAKDNAKQAIAGTTRSLVNNMVKGVTEGFQKNLTLVGVGYRAQAKGKVLNLTLGFSHPVEYRIPEGITIETPSQTEVVVKGISKQVVGQVASDIRAYRPPEPYKGKGVRYTDERVVRKEAKKK